MIINIFIYLSLLISIAAVPFVVLEDDITTLNFSTSLLVLIFLFYKKTWLIKFISNIIILEEIIILFGVF